MPRYVILEHDWPGRHWDLMLESGAVLRTWRLLATPAAGHTVPAEGSFDHRPVYLDYEGPVSGGRGSVVRWDSGTFEWEVDQPAQVVFQVDGRRLHGKGVLHQDARGEWSFQVEPPATGLGRA
jgi:hypothetical protein